MNILMMTNTYTPHIGGVARSVETFTKAYRERGHRVLVVAPSFDNMPEDETDVIRVRAIQNFNGSDFSVALPFTGRLQTAVEEFQPDIVHSHHPFLIGATAVRIAHVYEVPLAFTHHTRYEEYTHYAPGDSQAMKRFIVKLSTSYANLCDQVFAPSESISKLLRKRGVEAPIEVIPTGVDLQKFARGNGEGLRMALNIPEDALVVGHVGRLAPEKNLEYMARAVARFLASREDAWFVVVGAGPSENAVRAACRRKNCAERLVLTGTLDQPLLASAYRAMDIFAFASQTETQGMVITEAMAAGIPVVALSGPGIDEVVDDGKNGRLLPAETDEAGFADALGELGAMSEKERRKMAKAAAKTAERFSIERCVDKALDVYARLDGKQEREKRPQAYNAWTKTQRTLEAEWDMVKTVAEAAGAAIRNRVRGGRRKTSG